MWSHDASGELIGAAEVEGLLTQWSKNHRGGEKHIVSPLPACLTHSAVILILLVPMATMRCEGSTVEMAAEEFL